LAGIVGVAAFLTVLVLSVVSAQAHEVTEQDRQEADRERSRGSA
jgi:hypothetical protein